MKLINTTEELASACSRLALHPFVTVDTEFLRETTYYPKLCLIQIASPDEAREILDFGGRWGNCHIALGSAYTETYDGDRARLNEDIKNLLGFNSSDLHWDLVSTERKKVTALLNSGEGRVIYEDGEFRL